VPGAKRHHFSALKTENVGEQFYQPPVDLTGFSFRGTMVQGQNELDIHIIVKYPMNVASIKDENKEQVITLRRSSIPDRG
jgi:hypothetical protein